MVRQELSGWGHNISFRLFKTEIFESNTDALLKQKKWLMCYVKILVNLRLRTSYMISVKILGSNIGNYDNFLTAGAFNSRGGSRNAATSKMERFLIIVNGWKPLTIITKRSILDIAAVLDPPLIL